MKFRLLCLPALALALLPAMSHSLGTDIVGPVGSKYFGRQMLWLPNGNLVVTDPGFDASEQLTDVGAVHLYAPDGTLLSTLYGSSIGDQVGTRVDVLSGGDFVVSSPFWRNAGTGADRAGASTWRSATDANDDVVSVDNSLVGTQVDDQVSLGTTTLPNGHYYVRSSKWADGAVLNAGALTWGNGSGGLAGTIDATNSVIGSSVNEAVGGQAPLWLSTGKVALSSPKWDNGAAVDAGAIRIVSGDATSVGRFSPLNSLVGSRSLDQIGSGTVDIILRAYGGLQALPNGNLLVMSPRWDHDNLIDAGAVTWIDSDNAPSGEITSTNSLVGSRESNFLGSDRWLGSVVVLSNSNYLVISALSDGPSGQQQTVTFGHGDTGIAGMASSANSLVGNAPFSTYGASPVAYPLTNGNYIVHSRYTDSQGIVQSAITWGDGINGSTGPVSIMNSLMGAYRAPVPLHGGGFVVLEPTWSSDTQNEVGAVAWFDGTGPVSGEFDESIALLGSTAGDRVGSGGVVVLSNGHYLIASPEWQREDGLQVGAVSWRDGNLPLHGSVAGDNSVVGDELRRPGTAVALSNGNYVLSDPGWGAPVRDLRGAVTWMDGSGPAIGTPSPDASLLGQTADDNIGNAGIVPLANGNYLVRSNNFQAGGFAIGAVTWRPGDQAEAGFVTTSNSFHGGVAPHVFVDAPDNLVHADGSFTLLSTTLGSSLRLAPATGEAPLFGPASDANSLAIDDTGPDQRRELSYDPARRRWAIRRAIPPIIAIVDASELPQRSFSDGFESPL